MKALALSLLGLLIGCAHAQEWRFRVLLDGKPIGTHRFVVTKQGDERNVRSEASFAVKLLGITVYEYRHEDAEQWQGECLRGMHATTLDGGKTTRVQLDAAALPDCVMSYAYWNPLMLTQQRLLNAQTGRIDQVTVTRLGPDHIEVRGQATAATRWRITGLEQPIDLWYSVDQNQWLALDSSVSGRRRLSYRLE